MAVDGRMLFDHTCTVQPLYPFLLRVLDGMLRMPSFFAPA